MRWRPAARADTPGGLCTPCAAHARNPSRHPATLQAGGTGEAAYSDADFERVFAMTKAQFALLPHARQESLKKLHETRAGAARSGNNPVQKPTGTVLQDNV